MERIANDEKSIYLNSISAQYTDLDTLTNVEETTNPEEENPYIQGEAVITVYELTYMKPEDVKNIKVELPEEEALPAEE